MGSPRFQYAAERPGDNYCNTLGTVPRVLHLVCHSRAWVPAVAEKHPSPWTKGLGGTTTRPSAQFVELLLAEAVVPDEASSGGKDDVFGDVGRQVGDALQIAADKQDLE